MIWADSAPLHTALLIPFAVCIHLQLLPPLAPVPWHSLRGPRSWLTESPIPFPCIQYSHYKLISLVIVLGSLKGYPSPQTPLNYNVNGAASFGASAALWERRRTRACHTPVRVCDCVCARHADLEFADTPGPATNLLTHPVKLHMPAHTHSHSLTHPASSGYVHFPPTVSQRPVCQ